MPPGMARAADNPGLASTGGRALPFLPPFSSVTVGGCQCIQDAARKVQLAISADALRRSLYLVSRNLGAGRHGASLVELGVVAADEVSFLLRANRVDEAALQVAVAVFALLGGGWPGEEPNDGRTLDELLALCRAEFAASAPRPVYVRQLLQSHWPLVALHPTPRGVALPTGFSQAFAKPDGIECAKCGINIPLGTRCSACKLLDTGRAFRMGPRVAAQPGAYAGLDSPA